MTVKILYLTLRPHSTDCGWGRGDCGWGRGRYIVHYQDLSIGIVRTPPENHGPQEHGSHDRRSRMSLVLASIVIMKILYLTFALYRTRSMSQTPQTGSCRCLSRTRLLMKSSCSSGSFYNVRSKTPITSITRSSFTYVNGACFSRSIVEFLHLTFELYRT